MDKRENDRSRPNIRLSLEQTQPSQEVMNRQFQMSAEIDEQNRSPVPTTQTFFQKVKQSLYNSIGNIVFGLVFGPASTAQNSHTVFLAGATGAAAAAVSMMGGTYLDDCHLGPSARKHMAKLPVSTQWRNICSKYAPAYQPSLQSWRHIAFSFAA